MRVGVAPLIARELPGRNGLLNVRRLGAFSSKLTVRGRDQLAARADELQFQLVLVFKRLGKLDAGLIILSLIHILHGGTITLENAEGGGTLVTISIPTGEE